MIKKAVHRIIAPAGLVAILGICLNLTSLAWANVTPTVSADFSEQSPHAGEKFTLTIEIVWDGTSNQWQFRTPKLAFDGIEVINVSQISRREPDQTHQFFIYELLAVKPGPATLRAGNIFYYPENNDIAQTLKIKPQDIVIKKKRRFRMKEFPVIGVSIGMGAIVIAGFALFFPYTLRKKNTDQSQLLCDEAYFLKEIEKLNKNQDLAVKLRAELLSRVLRQYLSTKLQMNTILTTQELSVHLNHDDIKWSNQEKKWTLSLLRQLEECIYSGVNASYNDILKISSDVQRLIESKRIVT